jgi:hypothetical protein
MMILQINLRILKKEVMKDDIKTENIKESIEFDEVDMIWQVEEGSEQIN